VGLPRQRAGGWPKQTGGWIIASAGVGDFDGDGKFDVALSTRDGWLFAWKTQGKAGESAYEWNGFGHDPHNTNNYEESPTPYKTWTGEVVVPTPDANPEAGEDVATPDAGEDVAKPDAGGEVADSASDAAGPDAVADPGVKPASSGGGCASGAGGSGWLALLALALLAVSTRRRREAL
jgi:MYXO-CTERM domain-containing protein